MMEAEILDREILKIGDCYACTHTRGIKKGQPLLTKRPVKKKDGKKWLCARLVFCEEVENIPRCPDYASDKPFILHHCDNGWCVRISHLYRGSASDNMKDRAERNESVKAMLRRPKSEAHKESLRKVARTPEWKAKISAAAKKKFDLGLSATQTDAWRAAQSARMRGNQHARKVKSL